MALANRVAMRRRGGRVLGLVLAGASLLAGAHALRADEFKDRVNNPFKQVQDAKRTDKVLLPLLHAMDAPPGVVKTQAKAALFADQGPGWAECAEWAQKPPQKAVLDALVTVTKEEDRTKAFAFAQPYGVEGVDLDLISKGMYTELGEPAMLAAARHQYMPLFERAGILAHVEASRLAASGDVSGAIKLMTDWLFVCRQMADRPFYREKRWAMDAMKLGFERISDIVYTDLRAPKHNLDQAKVQDLIKRLRDRRGFLALDRLRIPEGDFIAREQLVSAIMGSDGRPNPDTFGPLIARAAASERPLRMFSSSAFWDGVREKHAGLKDTRDMLRGIQGDWTKRWDLNPFDRILSVASDYRRRVAVTPRFAVLQIGLGDIESLFGLRQELKAESGGARTALGVYGFFLRNKSLPRAASSARPEFIEAVDKDPYSRRDSDLEFFVPQRDTPKDADGNPKPHEVELYPPDPLPKFKVRFKDDVFVLYSVGPDNDRGNCLYAVQTRVGVPGDYLLFPPVLSLYRQRLLETNQLK